MNAVTDRHLSTEKKAALGQFFTSSPVAKLMASMSANEVDELHILDPGAGTGSLFSAAVAQAITRGVQPSVIRVTAYEVDKHLLPVLHNSAAA